MVQVLINLIKSARPRQALKNLSLLAPLVFSGSLLLPNKFLTGLGCILIFTILTSSIYFLNDIIDYPRDRVHPYKKRRPIASGKLPIPIALFAAIIGIFVSLGLSYYHNFFFFLSALTYLLLQLAYVFWLKHAIILDVLSIAGGFIIRVYAGAFAIGVHMNVWFLLCLTSLSLFLAVGKRKAELNVLTQKAAPQHRKTLSFYTPQLLDSYLSMFANSSWLAYALFTFFSPPPPISQKLSFMSRLPPTVAGINKWLMITIPIVIYGIMRYLNIIYQGNKAESPERVLLSDRPLLASVLLWATLVILILYGVGS